MSARSRQIAEYTAKRQAQKERAERLRAERKAGRSSGGGGDARKQLDLYGKDMQDPSINPFARVGGQRTPRQVASRAPVPQQQQQQQQQSDNPFRSASNRSSLSSTMPPPQQQQQQQQQHYHQQPPPQRQQAPDAELIRKLEEANAEIEHLKRENHDLRAQVRDAEDEQERLRGELEQAKRRAKRTPSKKTPAKSASSTSSFDDEPVGGGGSGKKRHEAVRMDVGFDGGGGGGGGMGGGGMGGSNSYDALDDMPVGGGAGKKKDPFAGAFPDDDQPPPSRKSPSSRRKPRSPRKARPRKSYDDLPDEFEDEAPPPPPPARSSGATNALDELPVGKGAGNEMPDEFAKAGKLSECKHCGRTFNKKALAIHTKSKVCRMKVKPKDMTAARLGDVAKASDIKKIKKNIKAEEKAKAKKRDEVPKWKRDRDALRAAMRAGKEVSRAIKNGVDLRDLPPPPPSNEPDTRTPCPHCGRKFASETAKRHIPSCAKRAARR